jgi:NAD(P)H dehydrogenase (quinone)
MIAVTGASGALGRHVIDALLETEAPSSLRAIVRSPEKVADLAARGVQVVRGDYDAPETLGTALAGVDRLLIISSSEIGKRTPQHRAVIEAAKAAGVGFIAYTSLLRADTSPLALAEEHVATEAMLAELSVPVAVLRNGWYLENFHSAIVSAPELGAIAGASGEGRISAALRADYAAAAASVLRDPPTAQTVYELAGDTSFTRAELAAEVARQSGKQVVYNDMPQAEYAALLIKVGLPEGFAAILADSDAGTAKGALFSNDRTLSRLAGRPTGTLAAAVATALASAQ